eukprot:TRINITY_DN121_c0_g1_i1.p1 TRINITY_DN121_c0_g1~~TRINITY_DN121_c0_g1_i1.p1  ORF type:complete len:368 (+),score=112.73 TRINITY_DN121_c0_g1_i1:3-1106(+)
MVQLCWFFFFFQAEDGIRDHAQSRGLGDVYKRQVSTQSTWGKNRNQNLSSTYAIMIAKVLLFSAVLALASTQAFLQEEFTTIEWVDIEAKPVQGLPQCFADLQKISPEIVTIFQQATGPNPNIFAIITELTTLIPEIQQTISDCVSQLPSVSLPQRFDVQSNLTQCIADITLIFNDVQQIVNAIENFQGDFNSLINTVQPLVQSIINAGVAANSDCDLTQRDHVQAVLDFVLDQSFPAQEQVSPLESIQDEVVVRAFKDPSKCIESVGKALSVFQEWAGMAKADSWTTEKVFENLAKIAGATQGILAGCVAQRAQGNLLVDSQTLSRYLHIRIICSDKFDPSTLSLAMTTSPKVKVPYSINHGLVMF